MKNDDEARCEGCENSGTHLFFQLQHATTSEQRKTHPTQTQPLSDNNQTSACNDRLAEYVLRGGSVKL